MILKYNGSILKVNNGASTLNYSKALLIPNDMDFVYFAKDLTDTSIPNSAVNSTFGDYMKSGTLIVNGTDANTYLQNANNGSNFLYKDLTNEQLDTMKAINSTYTYFIRCKQEGGDRGVGGILSWRYNNTNSYNYMVRADNQQLQLHTTTDYRCGSDFVLTVDRVYKVVISGSTFKAYNLDNNAEYSVSYNTTRNMSNKMTTFYAGNNEYNLTSFFALAGIARATTSEEDVNIKVALMSQSIYA